MATDRLLLLQLVLDKCATDPTFVPEAIDAATEGVKAFAQVQRDDASKLAAMLLDVLHTVPVDRLPLTWFTPQQMVEKIEPWYRGTEGHRKLAAKWGVVPSSASK